MRAATVCLDHTYLPQFHEVVTQKAYQLAGLLYQRLTDGGFF